MNDFSQWLEKNNYFEKNKDVKSNLIFGKKADKEVEISIFIPTYKRDNILKQALDSALNQKTDMPYDIVVVDNESEFGTPTMNLMEKYCAEHDNIIYYKNEKNIGMFGNWNRGFELVHTKWIVMLHDDDLLQENYLEEVLKVFREYDCGLVSVFSAFLQDGGSGLEATNMCQKQNKFKQIVSRMAEGKPLEIDIMDNYRSITATPTACAYNRKAVLDVGGFNDGFFPIADIVLFNKITYYYNTVIIPQFLAIRRIGENEMKKVLADCTRCSAVYLEEVRKKLYSGKKKKWIAEYGAAVNHLIFLSKKYDPDIDVEQVLMENNLPIYWNRVPNIILKGILGMFWMKVFGKNIFLRRKKRNGKKG